jgi:hypothetical protein
VTRNSANTESTAAAITGAKSTDEFPDGRACFRELMSDVNLCAVMFNLHAEIIYCNGHFILMTGRRSMRSWVAAGMRYLRRLGWAFRHALLALGEEQAGHGIVEKRFADPGRRTPLGPLE